MKTLNILFLIFLTFICTQSFAQNSEETLFGRGKVKVTGLWGGPLNAYSTQNDNFNYNGGGFFNFEINNDFLVGWTGYGTDLQLSDGRVAEIGGSDFLLGYTPNSHRVIHPIVYLQLGGSKLEVTDEVEDRVFVLQPNIGLEINVFQWFRIGAEVGYRFVNNVNIPSLTSEDLSSPMIGLRLKFGFSRQGRGWDD